MSKVRKLIDISADDFAALSLLAGRRQQALKPMIEEFLHHLAITTMNDELQLHMEKAKERILSKQEKD